MQTFSYKQTPLYYQDIGKGKVILLIHGFLENHSMWKNTIESFSSKARCIAPDLFGHGNSPAFGYVHSMKTYAEVLSKLMHHLQIEEYAVIGHSMGGYVALELLQLQPEKISDLVLLNSTPLADTTERKKDRERAIRAIQKFPEAFVQMAVKNLFLPENQIRLAQEIDEAIAEAKKCSQQGIIATLQGLKNRINHVESFAKANCNKLVIAGKKDQVVPFESLKDSIKNSHAKLLSFNGGHMSHLEFSEELNLALAHFLKLK
ncbi:alpha/beta hydrolase [Psychroflexus salis]|uniref:Alpha/beta hydrolase n=1 Tax=Psychroflexus salis TaxID=1526574 RepID=A0A916ZM58_9FLAO|nr:alpha/beta hydrolase [Psychroflexus salis]